MANLRHQRGELAVEGRIFHVELLELRQRLLRFGVLLAGMLGLLGAHLVLHLRVDQHLLGDRVTDQLAGHLVGAGLAPRLRLLRRAPRSDSSSANICSTSR
jgi:hypothetical protein